MQRTNLTSALKSFFLNNFLYFFLKKLFWKSILCSFKKSFSNFQEKEFSYILGKAYSEPWHIWN